MVVVEADARRVHVIVAQQRLAAATAGVGREDELVSAPLVVIQAIALAHSKGLLLLRTLGRWRVVFEERIGDARLHVPHVIATTARVQAEETRGARDRLAHVQYERLVGRLLVEHLVLGHVRRLDLDVNDRWRQQHVTTTAARQQVALLLLLLLLF